MNEYCFLIIIGVFNLSFIPSVTDIRFSANGIDLPPFNLVIMYALPTPIIYFNTPFSIAPENYFRAEIKGKKVQTDEFGLIGSVIAKRSYLLRFNR